jgi:hypothetical protein
MASQLRWTSKSVDLLVSQCQPAIDTDASCVAREHVRSKAMACWGGGDSLLGWEKENLECSSHYCALRERRVDLGHGGMLGLLFDRAISLSHEADGLVPPIDLKLDSSKFQWVSPVWNRATSANATLVEPHFPRSAGSAETRPLLSQGPVGATASVANQARQGKLMCLGTAVLFGACVSGKPATQPMLLPAFCDYPNSMRT